MNHKSGNHLETRPETHPETQEILEAFRLIVRALRVSSRATERDLGLSSAQLYVLQKLRNGESLSLNELARRTLTHQSSVSVVVAKLCSQGFVQKKPSEHDERRLEISITAKGRKQIDKAPEAIQDRLISAIDSMSETRKYWLADGLRHVVREAGVAGDPAPLFFEDK